MEENVSPELSLAPEPEQSQDPMDSSSQAILEDYKAEKEDGEDKDQEHGNNDTEEKLENAEQSAKTTNEFKKTWGFRRTTIAKREMPGDTAAESQDGHAGPVRRSGRQAKRTDKLEEFLLTTKRTRTVGRRSAPGSIEAGDPPSQTPTDAETASEASFDGNAEAKSVDDKPDSPVRKTRSRKKTTRKAKGRGRSREEEGSGDASKELQEEENGNGDAPKEPQPEEKEQQDNKTTSPEEEEKDDTVPPEQDSVKKEKEEEQEKEKKGCVEKPIDASGERASRSRSPAKAASRGTTPNKRDTKSRGGIKTRNDQEEDESPSSSSSSSDSGDDEGYDPNALYCICRQKHNKRFMICCDRCEEWFHGDCVGITEARGRLMERNGEDYVCPNCTTKKSQTAKPNGKPKAAAPGALKAEQSPSVAAPSAGMEERGDDLGIKGRIEKTTNPSGKKKIKIFQAAAEESKLPKCIGPGCEKTALKDSVYCGSECILRHAAAAMAAKSISEPKQKDQDKAKGQKKTPGARATTKKSSTTGRKTSKRSTEESSSDSEDDKKDGDEEQNAEQQPPPPTMSSWSSDHNYNAVTPEKTTPIAPPTVLNKTSLVEKGSEEDQSEKESTPSEKKSPASTAPLKGGKKSPSPRLLKTYTRRNKPATPGSSAKAPKKQPPPPPNKTKSKKPHPPPAVLTPSAPVASSAPSTRHHEPGASAPSMMCPTAPPNNQMRQNIRRSLTDILYKRVSDSDDLNMSENDVGKLAVSIEKEMFNLCLCTDSKYKNKYRSLMFNLKDPKNKGLFYRVVWGEVSPFRLVRLSADELLSKEISEWRKPDTTEAPSARSQTGQSKSGRRLDSGPLDVDMEDAPPMSDGDVCNSGTSPSPRMAFSAVKEAISAPSSGSVQVGVKSGSSLPDIFSMMRDTTAEHRAHLFDLNCKICTGQKSADDEPAAKKAKLSKKPEMRQEVRRLSRSSSGEGAPVSYPGSETPVPEPLPYQEDTSIHFPPSQTPAPVTAPAVSSVSITRRDPRMARHSSGVTVTHSAPDASMSYSRPIPADTYSRPAVSGPLPMPPAPPPSIPRPIVQKAASSETPPEGETAIFLHGQEMMWKGLVNMHTVAKFVTKAYLVSGSFEHLKEDLPDTIHIGGRISPSTVWDYVGKLKTSLSKDLCLIRFHPATEEEEVAYVSLFSYFSSRKRFGVVANNNRRIKDLYLIPLSSKDPLPSKLLPFDGPGLEPARPNLLLGLVICQKDKKRAGASLETEEKRSKIQIRDLDDTGLPKPTTTIKAEVKAEKALRYTQDLPFSTTPPGTPPPLSSSETSSTSMAALSVLSFLSSVKAPATDKESPASSSAASSAANATPLQTILKTLFGNKRQDSEASMSPSEHGAVDISAVPATLLDPIVQQFGQISKEKQVEEDEDDRPYDPEEEYDPGMGYGAPQKSVKEPEVIKQPEATDVDDVAYDPEDDTIFEEVKTEGPGQAKATGDLTKQQKMVDLNKQIEEQKQQLEEQEDSIHEKKLTTGTSAASFSVTDGLISPSLLANSRLLQLGKKVEEFVKFSSAAPLINQRRDPRQSRDPRRLTSDSIEKVEMPPAKDTTPPPQTDVQEPETPLPQEEVITDSLPFLESDATEVSIPLLGEHVEPATEVNYMEEQTVESEEVDPTKSDLDKYSIWPNADSILKTGEISSFEKNRQEPTSSGYFNMSTNNNSLASPTINGPPPMLGPPPMSVPPPMQSIPSLSGPLPMQRLPPPIQVPPPMQVESNQSPYSQYGPPPAAYPPYQNQWGGSQQQYEAPPGPPPQTMMPPRGPPPFQPMGPRAPPPQMFNAPMGSMPPQHMGQQGPPPGQPNFDGQNGLAPPRISGLPPPFNFPGPRAPPPPFTGPPPGHFDNRGPPPSHFPGPRGPPSHFGDHGSQAHMIDPPRGPVDQYNNQGMDHHQGQTPPHMYKDNQAPPQGPSYRGPPHNQYEGRRGPPPSGDMGGQRFQPPNQFLGSIAPSPPPHRGSYDDQGPPQDHRGAPPQHFGGPDQYRLDSPGDLRPVRHSGPLLPTPPEGPIPLQNRMGDRPSRFEGGHRDREPIPGSSQLSEERQRDLSEDRRRERDREGPHGARPWDRGQDKPWSREREDYDRDRPRIRDRERDRDRRRDRSRSRDRDRGKERESDRRDNDRDRARDRDRERDKDRDRHDRSKSKEKREDKKETNKSDVPKESDKPAEVETDKNTS
ncbi:unnamed protein product [Oncorhynchus mykiss]|uniref:Death-inducer obliterator 1-like n=1 Tax=Oncorhynchus mykiss TaxID=8022 RepID=A0A060W8F5_ONCMY|nr:unnamed protein product [Oncorhynchus mykiss]